MYTLDRNFPFPGVIIKRDFYKEIFTLKKTFFSAAAILILCSFCGSGCGIKEEYSTLESMADEYQGMIRTISQEEYDFYSCFVKRDAPNDISGEELAAQTLAYANEVNAVFYLGSELTLCEPYSFELLKLRMQQENDKRKIQKENGEVIYGPEQFDLNTYFQYTLDRVKLDTIAYMASHADETDIRHAKEYYEECAAAAKPKESITYELILDGQSETVTIDRQQLSFMGKSDVGAADFLETADVGDTYTDEQNGVQRTITVTEILYSEPDFEEDRTAAVESYIRNELFPQIMEKIAENNQVEFKPDN